MQQVDSLPRRDSIEFFVEGVPRTKGSSFSFDNPKTGKVVYVEEVKGEKESNK